MDQAIFFSSGYIMPITPLIIVSIGIILISIILFLYIRTYISTLDTSPKHPPIIPITPLPLQIPDITDPRFEIHALQYIEYLARKYYQPEHTWAHTPQEIYKYSNDSHLYILMCSIEKRIYTQHPFSTLERTHIQQSLKHLHTQI